MNAVLGIGSSVPEAHRVIDRLLRYIEKSDALTLHGLSNRHLTAPMGGVAHNRFVNAAVAIQTRLTPQALLQWCQAEEHRAGRLRTEKNAPRTLDIDVLYIEGIALDDANLQVPHPALFDRAFAWLPLVEALAQAGWPCPVRPL